MPKRTNPKLVLPAVKYKKSFLADFYSHTEKLDEYNNLTGIAKSQVKNKFPEFVKKVRAQAKGVFAQKGLVPQTVLWLVNGNEFLGRLSIRHYLNSNLRKIGGHIGYYICPRHRQKGYGKLILSLALPRAKTLGISKVLITCDETNLASKKIIEHNGGKLFSKISQGAKQPKKLKFHIML